MNKLYLFFYVNKLIINIIDTYYTINFSSISISIKRFINLLSSTNLYNNNTLLLWIMTYPPK